MGKRTISLDEEACDRLSARKRADESFNETVKRLTETLSSDWRDGFGRLDDESAARIAAVVESNREET